PQDWFELIISLNFICSEFRLSLVTLTIFYQYQQVKAMNIHKTNIATQMANAMGLEQLTLTENRHSVASRQRAAKATGDTGLGNSIATQMLFYDDHREAQGIVSKNLANAAILEKVAISLYAQQAIYGLQV
ncbi:MAG: hypothetical protein WCO71_03315, partial [Pseudomonadota bacterium]